MARRRLAQRAADPKPGPSDCVFVTTHGEHKAFRPGRSRQHAATLGVKPVYQAVGRGPGRRRRGSAPRDTPGWGRGVAGPTGPAWLEHGDAAVAAIDGDH